jgi:lysine-N-methylase
MQLRTKLVSEFVCLADKCEDTCCKHWSMQVDSATLERYRKIAPELLDAVEPDGDSQYIMRKDKQTGYCVKFVDGKCGIHLSRGENFLSDACNFYPRITRVARASDIGSDKDASADFVVMTATMSCPEIARIALYGGQPFMFDETSFPRLPQEMKNILPAGLTPEDAVGIHNIFIAATEDATVSAEHIFARISSASRSLQRIEKKNWPNAASLYLRLADSGLPAPDININDSFNLLHALCGLVVASKKTMPPRLQQTVYEMEQALHVTLDWDNVLINTDGGSLEAYNNLHKLWQGEMQEAYCPLLKRWLGAQLSASFYPFAGLGETLTERITIIGVRMAILRLALMSAYSIAGGKLLQNDVVRIVQSLSRFLDHLANSRFSLDIFTETGWIKEGRMLGLLN